MSKIICIPYNTRLDKNLCEVDVTSHNKSVFNPFLLETPYGLVENVWQYSKVYPEHVDENNQIKPEWFEWNKRGKEQAFAVRYPMGKGVKPLFSYWNGERLGYIESRKKVYIPIYETAVKTTRALELTVLKEAWLELQEDDKDLYLRDFDGYDRHKLGMSLEDVINNETRSMGHCFVIEKMLV